MTIDEFVSSSESDFNVNRDEDVVPPPVTKRTHSRFDEVDNHELVDDASQTVPVIARKSLVSAAFARPQPVLTFKCSGGSEDERAVILFTRQAEADVNTDNGRNSVTDTHQPRGTPTPFSHIEVLPAADSRDQATTSSIESRASPAEQVESRKNTSSDIEIEDGTFLTSPNGVFSANAQNRRRSSLATARIPRSELRRASTARYRRTDTRSMLK